MPGDTDSDSAEGSTTEPVDPSSTTDTPPGTDGSSSTGEPPPPGACGEPGDLAELWRVADTDRERGESISVADGRAVWVASAFAPNTRIRAHDLDGVELWSADTTTSPGEGSLRRHSVAAGEVTVFAGTVGFSSAQLMGFDDMGQVVFEHAALMGVEDAGGVAIGSDGEILFGGSDQDLQLRMFDGEGLELSSYSYDHGADEHTYDATADEDGYFLAGHSNGQGRPLLARVSADGSVAWVVEASVGETAGLFEVAQGVGTDGAGGAWLAVAGESNGGHLDHFDADGNHIEAIELSIGVQQVEVDGHGDLVVLGRNTIVAPIIVQRLTTDGGVLAETTLAGYWGLDLATDDACDVYVVGSDPDGAFMVKLD